MRTATRLFVMATAALTVAGSTALLAQSAPAKAAPAATPAATAKQQPAGPVPRLRNGKPDLSGLWANPYTPNMAAKATVLAPATGKPVPVSGAELPDAK